MSRGGSRGGGHRGGSPRSGGGHRGGSPRSSGGHRGGSPRSGVPMGGRTAIHRQSSTNRRPPKPSRGGRGVGNPLVTFGVIAIMLVSSAVVTLGNNLLWIVLILGVVAVVGMVLYYKYQKDRAEAYETTQMLNADLKTFNSTGSNVDDIANKYE